MLGTMVASAVTPDGLTVDSLGRFAVWLVITLVGMAPFAIFVSRRWRVVPGTIVAICLTFIFARVVQSRSGSYDLSTSLLKTENRLRPARSIAASTTTCQWRALAIINAQCKPGIGYDTSSVLSRIVESSAQTSVPTE